MKLPSIRYISYTSILRTETNLTHIERKNTTNNNSRQLDNFLNDSIKIVALPLNENKFYFHYIENKNLIKFENKILQIESKIVEKTLKYWNKLKDSKRSYATYTVRFVENLLEKLPWTEKSFATIPSDQFIAKRLQQNELVHKYLPDKEHISFYEYFQLQSKHPELEELSNKNNFIKPIKIYVPEMPNTNHDTAAMASHMNQMATENSKYFLKQMFKCILAMPLTIPLILIPLVPNIPGFYLTFRLYWNFKAYAGSKHIMEMYQKNNGCSFEIEYVPEFSKNFASVYDNETKSVLLKTESQQREFEELLCKMDLNSDKTNVLKAVLSENYKK